MDHAAPTLFDQPAPEALPPDATIDERFAAFHAANPAVFGLFVRFALEAQAAGLASYSAKAVFERVRWQTAIETRSGDPFKVNNDFTARYARLAMDTVPALADFFHTRGLRTP